MDYLTKLHFCFLINCTEHLWLFFFFFFTFLKDQCWKSLFFQWAESEQSRSLHVFSFRKWNSFDISELKHHCDTERSHVASESTKIKDRARTLLIGQKKGTTPLSDVQKVPQVLSLRAWPLFTKVSGQSVVYTLLWLFSQLSWLYSGCKRGEETVQKLSFICSWCRNYLLWLLTRFNATKQDHFTTWFSMWFCVWRVKPFVLIFKRSVQIFFFFLSMHSLTLSFHNQKQKRQMSA